MSDRVLRSFESVIAIMARVERELATRERPLSLEDGARVASLLQDATMVASQINADIETE